VSALWRRLSCLLFGHGPVWFNVKYLDDGQCGRCCGVCGAFKRRDTRDTQDTKGTNVGEMQRRWLAELGRHYKPPEEPPAATPGTAPTPPSEPKP
jgi:hypothetical protein